MTAMTTAPAPALALVPDGLYRQLVTRVATEEGVPAEYAERVVTQAIYFLQVCALNPGARLAPSPAVDPGWHAFVLHTREYARFCEQLAGRFIHHAPVDPEEEDGEDEHGVAAVTATVEAMRAAGLPVDDELWPVGAGGNCNQCHEGCYNSP